MVSLLLPFHGCVDSLRCGACVTNGPPDKYLMGYAIVMGLPEDIHLRGYEMNNCVSAIYWSYLAMTLVIPFALNKLPIGKWVGAMMVSGV